MKNIIRTISSLMAISLLMIFIPFQAQAQKGQKIQKANDTKFIGKLIGVKCIADQKTMELKHAHCTQTCVKNGQPMGLLTDDGTLVLLKRDDSKANIFVQLRRMVGQEVQVIGSLAERDGMKVLEVVRLVKM